MKNTNQWYESKSFPTVWLNDEFKTSLHIPQEIIDQVRIKAKKELLDEIENNYHWHIETPLAPEGENEYTLMIDEDDWNKLRAKTLGEK